MLLVRLKPSMKCYRKNGSDDSLDLSEEGAEEPSMKCYRKNGSDLPRSDAPRKAEALNEVLPKVR